MNESAPQGEHVCICERDDLPPCRSNCGVAAPIRCRGCGVTEGGFHVVTCPALAAPVAAPSVAAPEAEPVFWQFRYLFDNGKRGAWSCALDGPRTMQTGDVAGKGVTFEVRDLYAALPLPAVVQAEPEQRSHLWSVINRFRKGTAFQSEVDDAIDALVHPAAPQTSVPTAAPRSEPRALGQGELPVRAAGYSTMPADSTRWQWLRRYVSFNGWFPSALERAIKDSRCTAGEVDAAIDAVMKAEGVAACGKCGSVALRPSNVNDNSDFCIDCGYITERRAAMSAPGGGGRA